MADKDKSSKKDKIIDKSLDGWESALSAARQEFMACKERLIQLRGSIQIFEEKLKARAPYP